MLKYLRFRTMLSPPLCMISIFIFIIISILHQDFIVQCFSLGITSTVSPRKGISTTKSKQCYNESSIRNIFYIKIQKTASTSLKSSLLNYGMKKNLQICMDSLDLHHLNFPYQIDPVRLTKPYFSRCELIADELVFEDKTVKSLMKKDPFMMTSVRHPVPHFISLFKFARIQDAVQLLTLERTDLWDSIKIFLRHRKLVQNIYATYKQGDVNAPIINLLRPNLQLFSLGLHSNASTESIKNQLDKLNFIFISEHFEESMVLLASKLCCHFHDLIFVKQNVQQRMEEELNGIPEEIQSLILQYNKEDMILYEIAIQRFNDAINKDNSNFSEDLRRYQEILRMYRKNCKLKNPLTKDKNDNHCLQNIETAFYDMVRQRLKIDLLKSLQSQYTKLTPSVNP